MKKSYTIKKMDKLLRELEINRHSLAYLTAVQGTAGADLRKEEAMKKRIRYLSRTIQAVEHSLDFLDPTERAVITELYFRPSSAIEDVCAACALEKSSVYRYRTRALTKMASALFGGAEE